ncbi:RHS repeat-associated core domain-containing protein [Saccharothrix australiensis]|uniref:RHS repeat-associated protein n=1 Tax=Saccharothrix australiensis TaxID=2072 RepID=A0A495W1J8_9PSEU|nr:RHS repeat-associated core domain-containing protein [Saccharothrix australiensis]RKT55561.1 RHS repeat-associated protein [Saccharothrix australiensis]
MTRIELDHDGIAEALRSDGLRGAVRQAAEEVAAEVRGRGLRTQDGEPLSVRVHAPRPQRLRLVAVTNPLGRVWRYDYDPAGNLVREKDFTGRELRYDYDAAGRLVRRTNGAGETVDYVRDARGNVVEQRTPDETTSFTFDAVGRMTRAVNAHADVRFEHDAMGRVTAETVNGRTLSSAYDLAGRRTHRRTPTGAESAWTYNGAHQPTTLRTAGHTLAFRHDPVGDEVERVLGTRPVLTQTWDAAHRLVAQTPGSTGTRHYRYRRDGRLHSIEDPRTGGRRFDLDAAGRITAVTGTDRVERHTYDRAGAVVGVADVHHQRDAQGRVVLRRRKTLSGKFLTWRYRWNAEDRLIGVTTPDGTTWRYRYDPLGRRIAKERLAPDGETAFARTDFTWDGTALAEQVDAPGVATSWDYEPASHRPATQLRRALDADQHWIDREFHSIITDLVGAPAELLDARGDVIWRSSRGLWGAGDGPTPLRFPGQYHDPETGLHYNFQRYYDPLAGRYASVDPLGLTGGPNLDGYVDNPMHRVDPLGLTTTCTTPPPRPSNSPHYSVAYEAELDSSHFPGRSANHHFSEANRQLHAAFQSDPAFARSMEQLYPGIVDGVAPGPRGGFPRRGPIPGVDGGDPPLTWHHHPTRPGVLQLIPYEHHTAAGPVQGSLHPNGRGGMENWGGGRRR